MKKKVKLFSSMIALMFAISLMCVGVYAASSHTIGVTGTVSFTATDVFASITGESFIGTSATSTTTAGTQYGTVAEPIKTYSGSGATSVPNATTALAEWAVGNIAFTSTNKVAHYVITIKNDSTSRNISVAFSALPLSPTGTTVVSKYLVHATPPTKAAVIAGSTMLSTTAISVPSGQTVVVVVVATLNDVTTSFPNTNIWSSTITIANVA